MAVPPIFKDKAHQRQFDRQGFLVIPFLNEAEIAHMDGLFDVLHPALPDNGFFAGSYSPDMDYKKRVSEEIKVVFRRRYDELFRDYTPFGGAYLYKIPSPNSDLFIHQDWTVVDESRHVALNIWVPLCDITPENGPLMVLPGSHYDAYPALRAPTMRYFFDQDYAIAMRHLETVIVKAGEAVILNQSLVHYSPPNKSDKIRKAITAGVKTGDAQMIFHFKDPAAEGNRIEKFEMDDDFFIQFENFFEDIYKRPTVGKSVGFMEYEVPVATGDRLEALIKKMKTDAGFAYEEPQRPEPAPAEIPQAPEAGGAGHRPFWEVYTPGNILREIRYRVTGK